VSVRQELPFGDSGALAVSAEWRKDLLRRVQDDRFVHSTLSDELAASPGGAHEQRAAERHYHRPEIKLALQRLEAQRRWPWSKPTEEDALQAVLQEFIPRLADRVRAACDDVADLDRLVARVVEDDWVPRVATEYAPALPQAYPYPGSGARSAGASKERLNRIAAETDNHFIKKVVAYHVRHGYDADARERAEAVLLQRRRREEEQSGKTQAQAAVAASSAHDAELLRILQEVCRRVQHREFEEIFRERVRDRVPTPSRPGLAHHHSEQMRDPRDRGGSL
jgi:hypothetical protein